MQASKEVTSNRPILTSSCSRPRMDLRSGIGLGAARILGVRLPERAVPFVRARSGRNGEARDLTHLLPLYRDKIRDKIWG